MEFRTEVPITKNIASISYDSDLLLLGSCFGIHMAEKLAYYKYKVKKNPFGILFHSFAIKNLLHRVISQELYTTEELVFHKGLFHCFDAHSSLSNSDPDVVINSLNSALISCKEWLTKTTHVVITLGSAWGYRHIEKDTLVANCHKIPQGEFQKELQSIKAIEEDLNEIVNYLHKIKAGTHVVFTISPVRHLKDGFVANNRSKAHLIAALHSVVGNRVDCFYFPAYEIMMDELRDYRFYKKDYLHPTEQAITFIWEHFVLSCFANSTKQTMKKIERIQTGLSHRPFHPQSPDHKKFLEKIKEMISEIQTQYPHIAF